MTRLPCLLTVLLTASSALAADKKDPPRPLDPKPNQARLSRGPYIQQVSPEEATIVWRTVGESRPKVRFGTRPDRLDREVAAEAVITRVAPHLADGGDLPKLHTAPDWTWQYEARMEGLEADTAYFYAVFDDGRMLAGGDQEHRLHTYPPSGTAKPLRFWAVGDSGTADANAAAVRDAMLAFTGRTQRPLDLYIHVGDMAYGSGKDDEFQRAVFDMYGGILSHVVFWAAMGNHEGHTSKGSQGIGPYYDAYVCPTRGECGGLASGTEAYYAFDYGRVHFIVLDSHDLDRNPAAAMAAWLKADLEEVNADWIVCFFHHPPYSKGSHDSDTEGQLIEMRTWIMPILETGGVDLVMTGHSHVYERSMLMDGAYTTPTIAGGVIFDDGDGDPEEDGAYVKSEGITPHGGTIQVVTGHGGAGTGRRGTMPVMKRLSVEHGSTIIDIDGDTLTGHMIDRYGVRDQFVLHKRGQVVQVRKINPRTLPEMPPGAQPRPPHPSETVVERGATWSLHTGDAPSASWTSADFDASGWKQVVPPVGYGDEDDNVVLEDMRGQYQSVYLRRTFDITNLDTVDSLGINVRYDDGFVAYLNGQEVARGGFRQVEIKDDKTGEKRQEWQVIRHEATDHYCFNLKVNRNLPLKPTGNVLAIEGRNVRLDDVDFTLDCHVTLSRKKEK